MRRRNHLVIKPKKEAVGHALLPSLPFCRNRATYKNEAKFCENMHKDEIIDRSSINAGGSSINAGDSD